METNAITSIRLKPEMRQQLEYVSKELHRGKNWIINQALQNYLSALNSQMLVKEAKRQSLLASHAQNHDEISWEENSDTTDWQ